MRYFCNPVNVEYRYQFNADQRKKSMAICREAADPSMICFQGKYYIFASMTLSVWVSEDLAHWESRRLPEELPLYDYAPDVRVLGDYVYFCASRRGEICDRYRTKDILNGPWEKIPGSFDYWDPNLFADEDGRVYFYWGCSNETPIWGVELDPVTMEPLTERVALITGHPEQYGYERIGEDNSKLPRSAEETETALQLFLKSQGTAAEQLSPQYLPLIRGMFTDRPYIEGPWMDKYQGKYYLQYAFAGTQYNTYGDGVYVSDQPLGPFVPAENNPYSYKPGGFLPGAGHGSTMWDRAGNLWHTATMRISVNHDFERRVGIFPAGFDADGELFCNQRYGDWPMAVFEEAADPWREPDWYLLSYRKCMTASSCCAGHEPDLAADENVRTWWRAASPDRSEWLMLDLGEAYTVHAVQINFADDAIDIPTPGRIRGTTQARYIQEAALATRWKLEGSQDGEKFFLIEDKTMADTDLPHDLVLLEEGQTLRFLRLSEMEVPYGQNPCVSGLRVFGKGEKEKPKQPAYRAKRTGPLDLTVEVTGEADRAMGYNILWGNTPEKLYHSYLTFRKKQRIGALTAGRAYYIRVDAFNEGGITEGTLTLVEAPET